MGGHPVFTRLLRVAYAHVARMTWPVLWLTVSLHFFVSYAFFWLAGDEKIPLGLLDFLYFYIVTCSTVGYGDISPSSDAGRFLTYAWLIPSGVIMFTALIAKLVQAFGDFWRKNMTGKGDFSKLSGHYVIMGWHGEDTIRMIDLLYGDGESVGVDADDRAVVLCSTREMDNPDPQRVHFVQGESLADPDLLKRAGVSTAKGVIVHGHSDDQTLAAGLAVCKLAQTSDLTAHFVKKANADLLKGVCPHVECNVSMQVEMLVRAVQAPGSTRVQQQMLSTLVGPTQFSLRVPENASETAYGDLFDRFKDVYDATLLGVAKTKNMDDLRLNLPNAEKVLPGDYLYFMAARRLRVDDINWNAVAAGDDK